MTEQQKRDNIVYGITDNVFVEAGAGAGKTSLITKRIVNQLQRGILPEHLVVITFTNAAAGELYGRIAGEINDVLEKNPATLSAESRERLKHALEHMDRMTISTIHSFCYKLLKEQCFEAELPMEMELLEPADAEIYQLESLKKRMREFTGEELSELQEAAVFYSGNKYFKEWLEKAFLKICDKPEDVIPVSLTEAELAAARLEIINLLAKKLQDEQTMEREIAMQGALLVQLINQGEQKNFQTVEELYNNGYLYAEYSGIFKDIKPEKKRKLLKELIAGGKASICKKGSSKGVVNTAFRGNLASSQPLKDIMNALDKIGEEIKRKSETYFYFVLLKYAMQATAGYKKAGNGRFVTNDEILQRANRLVCGSASAREYFADRYRHIYVDEFQDTDHVQAELVWRLCSDENGKLRTGSLFVVGDPKQAIYRFRGGEPAVYYEIKERMEQQGTGTAVYELGYNFRSNQELIDWVNSSFEKAIKSYGGNYTQMLCQKPVAAPAIGLLKGVYSCDSKIADAAKEEKPKKEAAVLAELIQTLVKEPYLVADGKKNKLRRIEYRDFLILCWKMDEMSYYLKEFRRVGIPVEFSGKMKLADQQVLNRFCRLYRYLALRGDSKAREGAVSVVTQTEDAAAAGGQADGRLKRLGEDTRGMDGYALAQYLVNHPEYVTKWDEFQSKEKMYSIQVQLRQMVESVCKAKQGTAAELAEEFKKYVERGMERELPLQEGQNAVRFMNLHKAKGLQGTITVLTNRQAYSENRPTPELQEAVPDEKGNYPYYMNLRKFNDYIGRPEEITGYAKFRAALDKAWKEEGAEDIRLEYVAATRAKEVLIVMSGYDTPAPFEDYELPEDSSIEEFMTETQNAWTKEKFEGNPIHPQQATVSVETSLSPEYVPPVREIPEALYESCYVSLSPSMLENHGVKAEDETEEEAAEEATEQADAEEQVLEKRPKGKIFGTVMHRSFELLVSTVWEQGMDRKNIPETIISTCVCQAIMEQAEDLVREGKRLYFKNEETEEDYLVIVKEYLLAVLLHFVENGTLDGLLCDAAEVYTELPFSYYVYPEQEEALLTALQPYLLQHKMEDAVGKTIWINGTADLIIRKTDGTVHIVDYKSDSIKNLSPDAFETVLKQRYEGQMLLYRHSMGRLFGVNPDAISVRLQHLYEKDK